MSSVNSVIMCVTCLSIVYQDVSSSLMDVFGAVSTDDVQDQSLEQFYEWKTQKHHNIRNVRQATDKALCALSDWAANTSKVERKTELKSTKLCYSEVMLVFK